MLFFQFIITFILTVKILMFLRGITEKIHGRSLDPYNIVKKLKTCHQADISGKLSVS